MIHLVKMQLIQILVKLAMHPPTCSIMNICASLHSRECSTLSLDANIKTLIYSKINNSTVFTYLKCAYIWICYYLIKPNYLIFKIVIFKKRDKSFILKFKIKFSIFNINSYNTTSPRR